MITLDETPYSAAISALSQALEQPKREPVEFSQFLSDAMTAAGLVGHGKQCKALADRLGEGAMRYLIAPPKREWIGLTDEEIEEVSGSFTEFEGFKHGALWAEQKLKELNT